MLLDRLSGPLRACNPVEGYIHRVSSLLEEKRAQPRRGLGAKGEVWFYANLEIVGILKSIESLMKRVSKFEGIRA